MIPLPDSFHERGFDYRILRRDGRIALLQKSKPNQKISYELIIIQQRQAEKIYGRAYEAREVVPRPEQWGVCAWTPFNLEIAHIKFDELRRKEGFQHEGIA